MLGGLFSIRHLQETSEDKCGEISKEVAQAQAMIFATDKINNDPNLLPNISLGYDIRDYCESITKATQITFELFKDTCKCHKNTTHRNIRKSSIVALIGPTFSSTALVLGGILQMLNVTAVSGTTTSPELSSYTYKHLHRSVPSDTYLSKAMADIIHHFNWSYVAAVGADDSYGRNGIWSVIKEAENKKGSFCVALTEFIPLNTQTTNIKNIVKRLKRQENIRVITLWIYGGTLRKFFREVRRQNLSGRVWILSGITFTLYTNGFLPSDLSPLRGSVAFQPHNFQDAGFKDYMKTLLLDGENRQDLPEWWGDIRALGKNCSALTDTATRQEDRRKECVQNIVNDVYSSHVPYVIDAVYSVAHALHISTHDTSRMANDGQRKPYLKMNDMQSLLSRVNFTGLTGNIYFDKFGDRQSAHYDIVNFQQVQETDATRLKQVIVGYWDASERLHLDESSIRWNSQKGEFPKSECLEKCSAGTRKSTTSPCCWQCIPCPRGTINPDPGAQTCIECPRRKRSNEARTACVDLPLANLNYSSPGGIAVLVFGALGIVATLHSFAVICRFWNTPIVRACNRGLSLALLAIILLMFSLAFMNLFEPTGTICKIIYPWRYITYNLCLSLLLVKVRRISSAFEVPITAGLKITTFTNRMQAVIVTTLQAFLLIVLLPWSLLDPPVVKEHIYPEHYALIKCKAYSTPLGRNLFLLNCSYLFLQILLSAFCSFKIRNVPENFGEAKRIACSMYIFFISLLTYHPVEFSMSARYVTVVDCVTTLLSAYGFLGCVFLPKVYIILFRPELNTSVSLRLEVSQFSFGPRSIRVNPAIDSSTQNGRTETNLSQDY